MNIDKLLKEVEELVTDDEYLPRAINTLPPQESVELYLDEAENIWARERQVASANGTITKTRLIYVARGETIN